MARLTNDQIGRLAELEAAAALSRPVGRPFYRPLFRAAPLGDKYPTVDFIVDVLGPKDVSRGFFFVQVKGTAAVGAAARLPVEVSAERFNRLVRLPAPTYLIGVDVVAYRCYLVAAHRTRRAKVASITRQYPLDDDQVRLNLYREVLSYWAGHRRRPHPTGFADV